jgi:putative transposase
MRCLPAIVLETLSQDDVDATRIHLQRQHTLGPGRFRLAIEAQLSRRACPAKIGRPRKHDTSQT